MQVVQCWEDRQSLYDPDAFSKLVAMATGDPDAILEDVASADPRWMSQECRWHSNDVETHANDVKA